MKPKSNLRHFLALAGSSMLAISLTSATTLYFDGGTADIGTNGDGASTNGVGTWNTSLLNWDAGVGPHVAWNNANVDDAVIASTATVSISAPITVGTLTFTGVGARAISGSEITINNGLSISDLTTLTWSGSIKLGGDQIWTHSQVANSSSKNMAGGTNLNGYTLTWNSNAIQANNAIAHSNISGTGNIIKNGTGWSNFSSNTYIGSTTINNGTLNMSNAAALGNNNNQLTVNGGTLNMTGFSLTVGNLTGTGGVITGSSLTRTLTIGSGNAGGGNFQGVIQDGTGGTTALTKIGTGTITLSGANTFTGGTTVSAGTLLLDFSISGAPVSNILSGTGALTLGGSTLSIKGGTASQTVSGLTLTANTANTIVLNANAGTAANLTSTAAMIQNTGSTLFLDLSAAGTGQFETGISTAGIATWAVVKDSGGLGIGTINASKQLVRLASTALTASNPTNSTTDFSASGAVVNTVTPTAQLNSLFIDTTGGAGSWHLGANVAEVSSGVISLYGSNNYTISNGSIKSLTATNSDLSLNSSGTGGSLTVNANIVDGNGTSTVTTVGHITLGGTNSYTGATTINSLGTLKLGAAGDGMNSPLGTNAAGTSVTATGNALDLNGITLSTAEALSINGTGVGSTGALTNSGAAASYSGVVTIGTGGASIGGSGNITLSSALATNANTLTKVGTGKLTLQAASTRSGDTQINGGTLRIENATAFGTGSNLAPMTINNGGTLEVATTTTVPSTGNALLTLNNGATVLNGLSGGTVTIDKTIGVATSGSPVVTLDSGTNTSNILIVGSGGSGRLRNGVAGAKIQIKGTGAVRIGLNSAHTASVIGDWVLQGGSLQAWTDGHLGTGSGTANDVYFEGGTLSTLAAFTLSSGRALNFNHASGGTVNTTSGNLTLATDGQLNGGNGLTKAGTNSLIITAANSGFSGNVTISGGLLSLENSLALQSATLDTTGSIASSSATTGLRTTVTTLTLGGLTGNKNFSTLFNAANGYTGLTGLTLNPGTGVTNTYSADIGNGSGSLTMTKDGLGTQVFTVAQTHTGTTTINAGTLALTDTGSINSSSGITIESGARFKYNSSTALTAPINNNGGTISGTGTINVAVNLNSTSDIIAPGNSPGIQPYGVSQTWSSFTYEWETNNFTGTTAGTDFDQIQVTGSLDLTGAVAGSYTLDLISLTALNAAGNAPNFSEVNRSWDILTATGGITGFDASYWTIDHSTGLNTFTSSPAWGGTWSLSLNDTLSTDSLVLTYTAAIPEPRAALLGSLGLLMLLRRRR